MKGKLILCAFLMSVLIISPLISLKSSDMNLNEEKNTVISDSGFVNVMKSENGKIENISLTEYLTGVLAAETDLQYDEEALKAQVVAANTYLKNIKGANKSGSEVDISDDPKTNQGYINRKERQKKWGDNFEKKEKKAEEIVNSVSDRIITYQGKPIKAVYFELSCGVTLPSSTVWGEELPYLQSVQSAGDKLSPDYSKSVVISDEQFNEKLSEKLNTDIGNQSINLNSDENGYVIDVTVSDKKISGNDFRDLFDLNSSVFTVVHNSNGYLIKTLGNGHMVGMSQYGADYMAKQGFKYDEILKHYYPETVITKI